MRNVPPEMQPLDAGFIDLPQKHARRLPPQGRRQRPGPRPQAGRPPARAGRPRRRPRHRRLVPGRRAPVRGPVQQPTTTSCRPRTRLGVPRIYFEGDNVDNDALQDLLDLLQITCVDPEQREERWGVVVISKSGDTLETGRGLPRLPPRGGRVLRPALRVAASSCSSPVTGADEQAARPVPGRRLRPTRTS